MSITEKIKELKIVPVVVIKDIADAEPTLNALCEGGLPVAEITFRTACAADAIRLGCEKFPEMLIGAGTVINAEQCNKAIDCGAKFIVGPGFAAEVVEIARSLGSTGATIINTRGSVAKPKTILGITIDTEKEIVLSVVEKSIAVKIMEAIKEKAGVGTAAHGLCFFLPVEMSTLTIHEQAFDPS